jgi:osmotically-inducible protein OsmY
VRRRLRREPLVEADRIDLFTLNGRVYLMGSVATRYLKQLVSDLAARTAGVEAVSNSLVVRPLDAGLSDAELKAAVERELFWSAAVDAEQVQVSVDKGVVTLRGTVDRWYELAEAAREARQAGARRVRNRLKVDGWQTTEGGER